MLWRATNTQHAVGVAHDSRSVSFPPTGIVVRAVAAAAPHLCNIDPTVSRCSKKVLQPDPSQLPISKLQQESSHFTPRDFWLNRKTHCQGPDGAAALQDGQTCAPPVPLATNLSQVHCRPCYISAGTTYSS